ncbi:MAG: hypothetical protein M1832_006105 [Thelocarpon impressellum]|nr:MAG: hypothetical protein M1832_006105 [Thelocarpon impressellum]
MSGVRGFPVRVVVPEIEDLVADVGLPAVETILLDRLSEDYTAATPSANARAWYGRCVYEAGNDVCDDQFVTLRWEDDSQETGAEGHSVDGPAHGRGPKTASFHMAASTAAVCERRSRIYGTRGEIATDSHAITVHDHFSGTSTRHRPPVPSRGGHGGGDDGLARQFLRGIDAVKNKGVSAADAQAAFIGCGLADIVRSHALVFAAEDARRGNRVVDWGTWWEEQVEGRLRGLGGG